MSNPYDGNPQHAGDTFPKVWNALRDDSERQSPEQSNRGAWGQVLSLDPNLATTNTVDAVLRGTGVVHAEPLDGTSAELVIRQTRSMVQWSTASIIIPPWGLAYELPAGWARVSIRALTAPSSRVRFGVGVSEGAALRHWIADPKSQAVIPANTTVTLQPLPYSRRVEISVMQGSLRDPLLANWLNLGQSIILSAAPITLSAAAATNTIVSVSWEIVA